MIHACSPIRWRGDPHAGGPHHALVAAGTTAAFALGQLHAGMVTAFQQLLREHPDIASAIEADGGFPAWEAVGTSSLGAAIALQQLLQCRRLADLMAGTDHCGCRAILTFAGWQRLGDDEQWRMAVPGGPQPPPHPAGELLLSRWVNALLIPDKPAGEDDPPQHLHELAACAFRPLKLPGALAAMLTEQRLDREGAPDTQTLADALAGDATSRDALRRFVGEAPIGERWLDALLVAALNPPVCLTLLDGDDPIPGWDCLQPGRRFRSLCAARGKLPALDDGADADAVEAWIDTACRDRGWPLHGTRFELARLARDEVTGTPELAAAARWLADHRQRHGMKPPPATSPCTQYVAFLDAFIAGRGGLLRPPVLPPIAECRPLEPIDGETTPLPQLAALAQTAAAGIVEDLIDGVPLRETAARVLGAIRAAGWSDGEESVAATLRLPGLAGASLEA